MDHSSDKESGSWGSELMQCNIMYRRQKLLTAPVGCPGSLQVQKKTNGGGFWCQIVLGALHEGNQREVKIAGECQCKGTQGLTHRSELPESDFLL